MATRLKQRLRRRGASPEDAEDFVQEAFVRLSEKAQDGAVIQHQEAYLSRTAANTAIDAARRGRRWRIAPEAPESLDLVDDLPGPDVVAQGRERLTRLKAGFEALDPVTRAIVLAKKLEGKQMAEIARGHELSVSAVEKRLAKGMVFLMSWMEEE